MSWYYRRLLVFGSIFLFFISIGLPLYGQESIPISYGQTVSNSLTNDEVDTYTFNAAAGDKVVIRMAATSGNLLPNLRLFGPDNTELARSISMIISDPLPNTGIYTILASNYRSDTCEYNLTLERVNPGTGPSLEFGQTISGNLHVGDSDTYTFSANSGDSVIIRIASTISLYIYLYGPDGTRIAYGRPDTFINPLPVTGIYTILTYNTRSQSVDYNLTIERLNPGTGPSINYGQTISDKLLLGDLNTYTFSANQGDKVIIRMTRTSGFFVPLIRFYGPDGARLSSSKDGYDFISDSLPGSGNYTILASDYYGVYAGGDYNLTLERLNPGTGTSITFGQTISGTLQAANLNTHTFFANQGDKVIIRMTVTSGSLESRIRLYGPDGTKIAGGTWEVKSNSLPGTGTYTILASDVYGRYFGVYNLSLERLNPGTGPSINFGQTISGTFHQVGDLNTHTFSANKGDIVIIRGGPTSGSIWPYILLFAPDGTWLGSYLDDVHEVISDSLPSTGIYTILVSDLNSADSGDYNLTLEHLNPGTGPSINFGQTVSGQLQVGDLDTYIFSGNQGDRVVIKMGAASSSLGPWIRLYGPDGAEIGNNWSDIINRSLPSTGTYTILATDTLANNPGNYNLTLERVNPGSGPSINFGQTVSGQLQVGDLNTYTFSGDTGNRIAMKVTVTQGDFSSLTQLLQLFDPDGTEISLSVSFNNWINEVEVVSDPLPNTGIYTILFSDSSDGNGSYKLTIDRHEAETNLELTQQVDKFFVWHGAELTCTTIYNNNGDADASNVVIEIQVPSTIELLDGNISNGGNYNASTRIITWNVGTLPAGGTEQTVSFKARVAQGISNGTKIIVTAKISSLENPSPITASASTTVASPIIESVSPDEAGNVAPVTVSINGQYLDPNAKVKLSTSGKEDIIASTVMGGIDGTQLEARIDLTGKSPGTWDLVVTNPGGAVDILTNCFTIESGGKPRLWVETVAPKRFRVGRKSYIQVSYGNSGTAPSLPAAIWISLPANCRIQVYLNDDSSSDTSTPFDSNGNELFVLIGSLFPGERGNFTFSINPNQAGASELITRIVTSKFSAPESLEIQQAKVPSYEQWEKEFGGTWYHPGEWPPPKGSIVIRLSNNPFDWPGHVAISEGNGWAIELIALKNSNGKYLIQRIDLKRWNENDLGKYLGAWDPTGLDKIKRDNLVEFAQTRARNKEIGDYAVLPHGNQKNCILFVKEVFEKVNHNTNWWLPLLSPAEIYERASGKPWPGKIKVYDKIPSTDKDLINFLCIYSILKYQLEFQMSFDPNDKFGPTGFDPDGTQPPSKKRFISSIHSFPYMVQFENMETATAAVQDMKITDQLDENFDWSTFSFNTIQVGNHTITIPKNRKNFSTSLDLRPDMKAIVNVDCTFDSSTLKAQWIFRGKDPVTGKLTDFLPPNKDNVDPKGRGWVTYSVKPKANLPSGTVIRNKATIDFEIGVPPAPMDTPEWSNTIDITKPFSHVLGLSPTQTSSSFTVKWEGTDKHSGIRGYSIYVSDNGGSYEEWLTDTSKASAAFTGSPGHSYAFYSIATDIAGNQEEVPSSPDTTTTIGGSSGTPVINLTRTTLHFGAVTNGVMTGSQILLLNNSGDGFLNWTAISNNDWFQVSPSSGTGNSILTVSVDASGLSAGTYNGLITVSDTNASNSPQTVEVTLKVYKSGQTGVPFGDFATPIHGSTVRSSIPVTGWVLDDIGTDSINIYRIEGKSRVYIGDGVFVEGARPDVEEAYPDYPLNYRAGWGYMMLTNFLPNQGNGTFKIQAIAVDTEGHQVPLGTKTIICDNANAVKPFGAIDTPGQGGTASGSSFINWGWVLTPQPDSIPTDGSTINVYVDGIELGHPTYNIYRPDIAALFPGYANSEAAAGYFYIDTTAYENGVHTIQWTAKDSGGNTDGIGSRYFTIQNTGSSMSRERTVSSNIKGTEKYFFHLSQIADIPVNYDESIKIKRGFKDDGQYKIVNINNSGAFIIKIKELERLEIELSKEVTVIDGYSIPGDHLKRLPIGSTLDIRTGKFYWQPGAGFVGHYRLVFIERGEDNQISKKNIIVMIEPKFAK